MVQLRSRPLLDRPITAEAAVSVVLCVLLGTRISPIPFAPAAGLLGLALLPVLWPIARRYRTITPLIGTLVLAAVAGVILTFLNEPTNGALPSLVFSRSMMIAALIGGICVVLFARAQIGSAGTAIAYGAGMLVGIGLDPVSSANPWRFTYSLPVAVFVLALLSIRREFWTQIVALIGLGVIGVLNDSRSNSAILFLAAVILVWQRLAQAASRGRRRAGHVIGLALFAAGFAQLMQFSLLEGFFGEATQARTQAQVAAAGNVFLGGRPEAAASVSLIERYPWGMGSGTLPTGSDILAAKTGMTAIGYDPNNGYVERFMFGTGVELHSVIGDFWMWFGISGVVACIAMCVTVVLGLEHRLRDASLSALLAFLSLRFFWDLLFSPPASSVRILTLALPLAAVAVAHGVSARRRSAKHTTYESVSAKG